MRRARAKRLGVIAAAAIGVFALVLVLARNLLAAALLSRLAGAATGTSVAIGGISVSTSGATLTNVDVTSLAHEPIASIARIDATYNLSDLLFGSERLFGLETLRIVQPQITVIHHKDGSFNIPFLKRAAPGKPGPPLVVRGTVVDGSVTGIEELPGSGAPLRITNAHASFDLDTVAASNYSAGLTYHENGRTYPIDGKGTIDVRTAYAMHRWSVPTMPIARLLNFAIGNPNVLLASGTIDGTTMLAFTVPGRNGKPQTGMTAFTALRGVTVTSPSLAEPLRDLTARLDVSARAALLEDVRGSLAGVPVRGSGGVYDLQRPTLRFSIGMHGDFSQLRNAIVQARRLPIAGEADLRVLAQGLATASLVTIAVRSSEIRYQDAPVRSVDALAAFSNSELDIVNASANYASLSLGARGRIALVSRPNAIELLGRANAPANRVPYVADFAPGMPLDGTLLATATNPKHISTSGVLSGRSPSQQLASLFAVTSAGQGTIGPLVLSGSRGNLYAAATLDHPSGDHSAIVVARGVRIASVNVPALPGFHVPALPPLHGTLDVRVLGALDRGRSAVAGTGRLRGSLTALNAVLPQARARGNVDAPFGLLFASNRAIVQTDRARFSGASIGGVALDGASATVALAPRDVHVLAARVRGGGASAIASGKIGANDRVALSADRVPILGGSVSTGALVRANFQAPAVSSTVLAQGLTFDRIPVSAMSALDYGRGRLGISNAAVGAGPADVTVSGSVGGLALGAPIVPRYNLDAQLQAANVRALAAMVQPSRAQLVSGSVDGNVHIGGSGAEPDVRGSLRVPEGSVNGLSFTDLHGALDASPRRIAISKGAVTVGTTDVAFHADAVPGSSIAGAVDAPHATLADFNDFFDAGDTLGGQGSVDATFSYAPHSIASSGSATLFNARYQRLTIGNVESGWSTNGRHIAVAAIAGGESGTLRTSGTIDSQTHALDLAATLSHLDLRTWLPAFGISQPVTGYLDANGTASGTFPNVTSAIKAHIENGTVGAFTLEQATVALHTQNGEGRIDSAVVQVPEFSATASGTFGFYANDRLAIAAQLKSPDIGALVHEATGKPNELGGSFTSTLHVNGTRISPLVTTDTDIASLRYGNFTIPRIIARALLDERAVTLESAQADFERGRVLLSAQIPIHLSPPGIARDSPITASLTADDLELSNFAAALPKGTNLAGRIDGTLHANGEIDNPQFDGLLTLAQGSYSGPEIGTPITGGAQLAFAGRQVRLQNAVFDTGDGTISANALADVPSLRDPNRASLQMHVSANGAVLNLPKYYRGRIDGAISLLHTPGSAPVLGGTVTLSSARVPLAAFLPGSGSTSAQPSFPLAFDGFTIVVGNDVRVQSPNVDVGAQGRLTVNGALAKPLPTGAFTSTGGTLSFYRTFTLARATVSFSPRSGIIPDVDAVATTFVTNPNTEIHLHVTGPATSMNLALSSQPPYDRSQILGLLVGAQQFGAVQGIQSTGGANFSATGAATSLAAGQLNTVFARSLLEPLSTALQSTLGLTNVQLTSNLAQGQVGAQFAQAFGHDLRGIFNETLGYPQRASFTLEATPNETTAVRLMIYSQPGATDFLLSQPPAIPPPGTVGEAATLQLWQLSGTNGLDLSYVRRYW